MSLMSYEFRNMEINLCSGILDPSSFTSEIANNKNEIEIENEETTNDDNTKSIKTPQVLEFFVDLYDLKRL
jgi:hypothetical protein